jgi:hypothetical protein
MDIDNPNKKGTLGEIAVCKDLIQQGYEFLLNLDINQR